jgi:hypothetical protein
MTTPAIQFCRQCSAIDDGLAQSSCSTFFQSIDFLEVREASYRYLPCSFIVTRLRAFALLEVILKHGIREVKSKVVVKKAM